MEKEGKAKLTKKELFTLCVIGSVHLCGAMCVALQAPFYPQEAELKGATATEYGFVFGVYELVSFISSPILGKYMSCIGAKFLLNAGMAIAAIAGILFGLLELCPYAWFISLSFLLRIIEAIGSSAAVTAAFAITATVFPNSIATTFATLEVFYGLGYILGPTLGGLLYSAGGFMLPFIVIGSVMLIDCIFIYFALPPLSDGNNKNRTQGQLLKILKVKAVILDVACITATAMSMGFYSAILAPHLKNFDLGPIAIGGIFVISGGTYAFSAPVVGRFCDTRVYPKKLILLGSMLITSSYVLVGPFPFFKLDPQLWMCIVGLIFHGLGIACILVSCFIDAIRSSVAYGLPNDITTFALVSGLWASSFALGDFIGPSVAGYLYDLVGFRMATLFIISVHVLVFISVTAFLCVEKRARPALIPVSLIDDKPIPNWTDSKIECPPSPSQTNKQANGYGSTGNTFSVQETSA